MACGEPYDFGVKYMDVWTTDALNARFLELHPDREISRTSVLWILNQENPRPHRVKMCLHSPDPDFREKVTNICSLYLGPPAGAVVQWVDEKTGMQALGRKYPVRVPAPNRDRRMDYEYARNGTRKLWAAFDAQTVDVYGEVRESRTAEDLVEFMEAVPNIYPEQEVRVIRDNLNIHFDGPDERWATFNARHGGRFHFHYTPNHASWSTSSSCSSASHEGACCATAFSRASKHSTRR